MGIFLLTKWWWPARAIAFASVFYDSDAAAQVVAVSFDSAQAIPISTWTVVSLAAALGLAAYWALRSRASRTLRVLVAATITASVVAATFNWIKEARAADPGVLSLAASPALLTIPSDAIFGMTMSGSGYLITAVNATGRPVTITGVEIQENSTINPLIFYSGTLRPLCAVGLTFGTNATCYLFVQATNHFD